MANLNLCHNFTKFDTKKFGGSNVLKREKWAIQKVCTIKSHFSKGNVWAFDWTNWGP
jgi:hypothetical protein